MKKVIALLLCVLGIASLAACGNASNDNPSNVQIPSPFADCDTLDDAAAISGFDMSAPDSIDGYDQRIIQAVENEMIQVSYQNGDESITIRKAAGTDDCSGDYNRYDETKEVAVGAITVTMKGSDGLVNDATWTNGDHAYAIVAFNSGLSLEAVTELIQSVD